VIYIYIIIYRHDLDSLSEQKHQLDISYGMGMLSMCLFELSGALI
jgi:hypothetical protein